MEISAGGLTKNLWQMFGSFNSVNFLNGIDAMCRARDVVQSSQQFTILEGNYEVSSGHGSQESGFQCRVRFKF